MSLTDHDGVAGVAEASAAAEAAGITNVPGVEMSCVHRYSEDLHICGYWIDTERILPACERAQQERVERAKEIIARLNGHGVEVSFEDAVAKAGAADAIGRPHIAKAAGAGPDLGPFFEEYLVPGAKAFVSRSWPTAEQAVELIHDAGGRRGRRPSLLGRQGPRPGPRPGREPGPRRRPRRDRDLLPAAHRRADQALPRALRGVRPRRHRLVGLPRPDPQDVQPLGRLRHLRARRAASAGAPTRRPSAGESADQSGGPPTGARPSSGGVAASGS